MSAITSILSTMNPARWTGPIFTKELRVTSRRWPHFALRAGYILLMLVVLAVMWFKSNWDRGVGGDNVVYEAANIGKGVIATVAWFQFLALQLVAMVLACTSINQEIYSRSLGVLMSTPVTSFQIVTGKLAGKMLQIVLLLAISLPVLAILRVMGGVPAEFVVASSCVTFTACLFAASLGIFYSTFIRRPYAVILLSMLTLLVLYAIVAWIMAIAFFAVASLLQGWAGLEWTIIHAITAFNPFYAMGMLTAGMWEPQIGAAFSWGLNCLVMAGLSVGLLAITVPLVRRRALRSALGGGEGASPTPFLPSPALVPLPLGPVDVAPPPLPGQAPESVIEEMVEARRKAAKRWARSDGLALQTAGDNPVFWRERRIPLIQSRPWRLALRIIALALLGLLYLGTLMALPFSGSFAGQPFCVLYTLCAVGCLIVVTATPITAEKEAGTWGLLLATTLGDWPILLGKAGGALRRTLPMWLFLLGHCVAFSLCLQLHPLAIALTLVLAAGTSALLVGSGLFFSACFRKTTTAVVANLTLALALWVLLPLLTSEDLWIANPVVQVTQIVEWAARARPAAVYPDASLYWFGRFLDGAGLTVLTCAIAAVHAAGGALLFWAAKGVLRRRVF